MQAIRVYAPVLIALLVWGCSSSPSAAERAGTGGAGGNDAAGSSAGDQPHGRAGEGAGEGGAGGGGAGGGGAGGAGEGGEGEGGAGEAIPSLSTLPSVSDYERLANERAAVKYLATVDAREAPAIFETGQCLFQNTARFPYHLQFLRTFSEYAGLTPAGYADLVLRRATRSMWGGKLTFFRDTPHPITGQAGVFVYTLYSESGTNDLLTLEDIVEAHAKLEHCVAFAADSLVFTADGPAQQQAVGALREALAAAGVAVIDPNEL